MLLAQNNPISFYSDINARSWGKKKSKDYIAVYPILFNGYFRYYFLPTFSLIFDNISSVTATVFDCDNNPIFDLPSFDIIERTGYSELIFKGGIQLGDVEGFYYIKLSVNGVDYFSDMFYFTEEVEKLIKINVQSSRIGNDLYEFTMQGIGYEFYLYKHDVTAGNNLKENAT